MALTDTPEFRTALALGQQRLPELTPEQAVAIAETAQVSETRDAATLIIASSLVAEPMAKYDDLAELIPDIEGAREFRKQLQKLRRYIERLSELPRMEFDLLLPGESIQFGPDGPISTPIRTTLANVAELAAELGRWEAAFDEAYDIEASSTDPRLRRTKLRQNIVARLAHLFDHFNGGGWGSSGFRLSYIERVLEAAGQHTASRTLQNWLEASTYPAVGPDFMDRRRIVDARRLLDEAMAVTG